jgi:hypothetical protein
MDPMKTGRLLTAFEQVLLGMIFGRPATGYDLKRRFATSA